MIHSMAHNISNNEQGFADPYKNEPFLDHYENEVGGKIRLNNSHKEGGVGSLEGEYNKVSGRKSRRRSSLGTSSNYNKENNAGKTRKGELGYGSDNYGYNNQNGQEPRSARRRGRRLSISGAIDTSKRDANHSAEINGNSDARSSRSQNDAGGGGEQRAPRRGRRRRNSISGDGSNHNSKEKIDDYDDSSASIFSDPYSDKPFLQKAKLRMEFPNTQLKGAIVSPSEEEKKEEYNHNRSSSISRRRRRRRNSIGVCDTAERPGVVPSGSGSVSRPDSHREDSSYMEENASVSTKGSTSTKGGRGRRRDRSSAKVGVDFIKALASASHPLEEEPQQRRGRRRRSSIAGSTVSATPAMTTEHNDSNEHIMRGSPRRGRRASMSSSRNVITNGSSNRSLIQSVLNSTQQQQQQQQQQQVRRQRRSRSVDANIKPSSSTESPLSKRDILRNSRTSAASTSSFGSSSGSNYRGGSRRTGRRGSLGSSTLTSGSDIKNYRSGINTYTIESTNNSNDNKIREGLLKKMRLLNRTIDEFNNAANKRLSTVQDLKERIKSKRMQYEAGMGIGDEGSIGSSSAGDNPGRHGFNHDKHAQKMEVFYKKTFRDNTKKINRLKKDNKDKVKNLSKLRKELEKRVEDNDKKVKKNNSLVTNYQTKADQIQKEVMVITTLKDGLSISVGNLSEENKELANSVEKYQRLCENESLVRLEFQKTVFDVAQVVQTRCKSKILKKEIKSIILRCDKSSKKIINKLTKSHGKRFEIIKDTTYASSYYSASSS